MGGASSCYRCTHACRLHHSKGEGSRSSWSSSSQSSSSSSRGRGRRVWAGRIAMCAALWRAAGRGRMCLLLRHPLQVGLVYFKWLQAAPDCMRAPSAVLPQPAKGPLPANGPTRGPTYPTARTHANPSPPLVAAEWCVAIHPVRSVLALPCRGAAQPLRTCAAATPAIDPCSCRSIVIVHMILQAVHVLHFVTPSLARRSREPAAARPPWSCPAQRLHGARACSAAAGRAAGGCGGSAPHQSMRGMAVQPARMVSWPR